MDRKEKVVLQKLVSEIRVIDKLLDGYSKKEFLDDDRTQRAVAMTLINIGELVKVLSIDFRKKHNIVSW